VTSSTPQDDLQRQADRLHDADRLGGQISQHVVEHLAHELSSARHFGTDEYEAVDDEEYRRLGYDPDDPYGEIVIKRKRDGAYFELEIDVTAHPVRQKTEAEQ
jgi:hypothetical protein